MRLSRALVVVYYSGTSLLIHYYNMLDTDIYIIRCKKQRGDGNKISGIRDRMRKREIAQEPVLEFGRLKFILHLCIAV